jgi:hypothetical protein
MANSIDQIKFATGIVDPIVDKAPVPLRHNMALWATACLLVEPAYNGLVDPDASDFTVQALNAIKESTDWGLHHDRAELVLGSEDQEVLGLITQACRQARALNPGAIHG